MKDKEFLQWIHNRLKEVHKENVDVDYMHKLRAIIKDYPDDKITPNVSNNYNPISLMSHSLRHSDTPKRIFRKEASYVSR